MDRMLNQAFCTHCRKEVPYFVFQSQINTTVNNKDFQFSGKKAICSRCKNTLWIPSIMDHNIKTFQKVYNATKEINNCIDKANYNATIYVDNEDELESIYNVSSKIPNRKFIINKRMLIKDIRNKIQGFSDVFNNGSQLTIIRGR